MATAGPTLCGTGAVDVSVFGSGVTWGNPGFITANDASFAVASAISNANSARGLAATNFGFSVSGTINGIQVGWSRKASSAGLLLDLGIRLIKGGVVQTPDKSSLSTWGTAELLVTYGATNDLWSGTWTPSDINLSTFGAEIAVKGNSASSANASVNYCQITVTYTPTVPFPFFLDDDLAGGMVYNFIEKFYKAKILSVSPNGLILTQTRRIMQPCS